MTNKKENKKANQWDFNQMQESLVKDHEKKITQGFENIKSGQGGAEIAVPASVESHLHEQPKPQEPTKGVQTYIPMSEYIRLNNIRAVRGETIGNLVAQAIILWLDVQEGKRKVSETT